ncbi:hypothetical protein BGZ60DRAFT_523105 [Tricladium varicosporioides]|nr:hypothetical protein BGZ60DRAFT_523105 [Hymenoscyphus varicosporioides]
MAEAIGLIASGISIAHLAGEVTRTVIKLKDYWDQIKDAPGEINLLLREIESLGLIMCHIQDDTRKLQGISTIGNIHLFHSLELCNEGVNHLASLVSELDEKIFESRSRWRQSIGCVKVVLKKDEIKRLKKRMKSAIQLLSLSYQCHTNAMVKLQPDIIAASVADRIAAIQAQDIASSPIELQEDSEFKKPGYDVVSTHYNPSTSSLPWLRYIAGTLTYKQEGQHRGKEKIYFQMKYEFPRWLSQRTLDCARLQSLTGMRIHFRTYRGLPYHSPFFEAVRSGNIPIVQEMLSKREAFVTDTVVPPGHVTPREHCFYLGKTPLHLAASTSDVEMCRLLVSHGADPLVADENNLTPFHLFAGHAASNTFYQIRQINSANPRVFDTCRFLLDNGSADLLINNITIFKAFHGSISLFKYLQRQTYPPYYELPIDTRCRIAESLMLSSWHNRAALIELALTSTTILDSEAMGWKGFHGRSLLVMAVSSWSENYHSTNDSDVNDFCSFDENLDAEDKEQLSASKSQFHLWRKLVRKFVSFGADPNFADDIEQTPLLAIVNHANYYPEMRKLSWHSNRLEHMLRNWLEDLYSSGVDLQQYGEREHAKLGNDFKLQWICRRYECYGKENMNLHNGYCSIYAAFHLTGFSYGRRPEDWKFWFSEYTDQFTGDFWNLVALQERADWSGLNGEMPGSWIYDTDD